jgi:hypothetical protein
MKSVLTVLAVLLLVPAAASAMPIDGPVTSGSLGAPPARGTNVAAPDQQSPKPYVVPSEAYGTNVAAPDQQSPTFAPAPVHVAAPAPGFDWGTAAIGAATSLLLMTALFGIAVTVRRRHSVITG